MANNLNINKALIALGDEIIKNMKEDVPVDTGRLRNSISYVVKNNILYISMENYGQAVNDGTKPHMPPVKSLDTWAKKKGLNPWAVATNIKKYGTDPHPFMNELDNFEDKYAKMFEDGAYNEIENFIYKTLNEIKRK